MTASVLTRQADAIGRAGTKPMFSSGVRPLICRVYEWDQGTDNYTVGGEDIATIWTDFNTVLSIDVNQKDTNTAADNRIVTVDHSGKKLLIYTAINTESTATDQGVVTVTLTVIGY